MSIRPATPSDTDAIVGLGVSTGMFKPDEAGTLRWIIDEFHAGRGSPDHRLEVAVERDAVIGAVYYGPDAMTDRKWDLWMIAVAPDRQGQGVGTVLIEWVEKSARDAGGRLLLVDTSSRPKYDATRAFYVARGFVRVAEVPDFYTDGDGKVTFSKRLAPSRSA